MKRTSLFEPSLTQCIFCSFYQQINNTFTAEITDVNEKPSVITLKSSVPDGTMEIPENTKVDDVIALLTAFDPDTVDVVAINVTSPSDPRLKLEGRGTVCEQVT